MKIKVYVGWIDDKWHFVDAPNKRIAKWCVANLYNQQYLDFKRAKDVKKIKRFKCGGGHQMTTEQIYENIMDRHNKELQKHPELAMNKFAAISGMIAQAKRDGAIEVLEEIVQAFRKHGVTQMLNKLDELEERYEVDIK